MNQISEPDIVPLENQLYLTKSSSKKDSLHSLRIVIVDDEPLARRSLRRAFQEIQDAEVVGEYSNGEETIKMISVSRPDVIFLDVEMPGINGLELARRLQGKDCPYIVFVTAYDQYALEAFHVQAIDYILKPICEEKVREVMKRVTDRVRDRYWREVDTRLDTIVHIMERQKKESQENVPIERITIKNHGRIYFVETSSIDWIQAEGNYVTLYTGSMKHLLRIKMNQLEERLNSKTFIRIHRSIFVNINSIAELRSYFNGSYLFVLKNTTKIFSSRGYRKNVEKILQQIG